MIIDCNINYKLPSLTLVGGQTEELLITVLEENGAVIDATTLTSELSLYPYGLTTESPLLSIKGSVYCDDLKNLVNFKLMPQDTVNLSGQFLYQVSLVSKNRDVEIYQGILTLQNNISKDFVTVVSI